MYSVPCTMNHVGGGRHLSKLSTVYGGAYHIIIYHIISYLLEDRNKHSPTPKPNNVKVVMSGCHRTFSRRRLAKLASSTARHLSHSANALPRSRSRSASACALDLAASAASAAAAADTPAAADSAVRRAVPNPPCCCSSPTSGIAGAGADADADADGIDDGATRLPSWVKAGKA